MAKKDAAKKSEEELEEELEDEQADASEEEEEDDGEEASDEADEGEEEDEEEDEPVAAAPKAKHAAVAATAPAAEDPNWWVPHLVLGVLVIGGVLGFFGAFTSTLGPLLKRTPAASASASAAPAPAASSAPKPGAEAPPAPRPTPTAAPAPNNDPVFAAKHVLVTFKGARNAKNERTKEEAKKRADEALAKLKAGTKFEDVVGEYSDEPGAKATGGNLGRFKKDAYDPTIVGTVMKLEVGKTSEIFESPFGYEIVLRTE